MDRFTDHFLNAILIIVSTAMVSLFVGTPYFSYQGARVTREALNEQCGTDYSVMDVLMSGDTLKELCKMKNQELLIKQ